MREGVALKHWTVDKRIPVALLVTVSLQTCAIVWWASGLTSRVEQLEKQAIASAPQADRLTRVEVKLEGVQAGINEIKQLMQRPTAVITKP